MRPLCLVAHSSEVAATDMRDGLSPRGFEAAQCEREQSEDGARPPGGHVLFGPRDGRERARQGA